MAGGVALNCVAVGKIIKENIFQKIWVQPASGDAGGSLGAALAYWHIELKKDRVVNKEFKDSMKGSLLGYKEPTDIIRKKLKENNINFKEMSFNEIIEYSANYLSKGNALGWYQNKMEFGPRALGCRSILADPRNPEMQKKLNLSVKFRESFRPFAPIILKDKLNEWFDLNHESPYMGIVTTLKEDKIINNKSIQEGLKKINNIRSVVPSITHVDYSARIQTVDKNYNYEVYSLLKKFYEITNVPILVNTSFNLSNEPIVNSVLDAYKTFLTSDLEILVCDNFIIRKNT